MVKSFKENEEEKKSKQIHVLGILPFLSIDFLVIDTSNKYHLI